MKKFLLFAAVATLFTMACNKKDSAPEAPNAAREVSTDSGAAKPATPVSTDLPVSTCVGIAGCVPVPHPTASACEPYRETVQIALARGRNAMAIWQDLVDQFGFEA